MTNDDENDWITGQEAATLLRISERSVQRYAGGQAPRLRSRKRVGSKKLYYYRPDVEGLAAEMVRRPPPLPPEQKLEMLPAGATLDYLRQRDDELREAQRQLQAAALELGQARAELQRRALVDEQLSQVAAERDEVRRQIARLKMWRAALVAAVIALLIGIIALVLVTGWR